MNENVPDNIAELVAQTEAAVREHIHPIFAGMASISVVIRMPGADFVISNDTRPEAAADVLMRDRATADETHHHVLN